MVTIWQFLVNVNRNIIHFVMCTSYHIVIVLVFSHHYDAVLIAVIAGNLGRQRYLKYWTFSFSSVDFSTKIHCLLDVIFIALNCKNSVYIRDAWIRLFGVSLFQVLTMQTLLYSYVNWLRSINWSLCFIFHLTQVFISPLHLMNYSLSDSEVTFIKCMQYVAVRCTQ